TKENKEQKEKTPFKWDRNIIITIILAIFILWFFWKNIIIPFYVGFRYYDQVHGDKETSSGEEIIVTEEEDIDINSDIVTNTYNKINIDNCLNSSILLNRFYGGTALNSLGNIEKMILILNNYANGSDSFSITLNDLNTQAMSIFNDTSFITTDSTFYGNYQLTFDEITQSFNVTLMNPNTCSNNFLIRQIDHATTLDDELYIYEKFGYFKLLSDNTYEIYDDSIESNLIGNYTDTTGNKEYSDITNLKTYKWTFKKGNDNNYYFVSITPE
ncbi:MAG TPA: hypothetical protein IAB65_01005, partial [Candidatus Onthocola stercorigallinarum]|nr:hypothetical protein [Candidatus Onthocola stercorigallinarum]